jgi:hypothetical protein
MSEVRIAKPDRFCRKPKPDAMLARCRLVIALSMIHQKKAIRKTASATWNTAPRTAGL